MWPAIGKTEELTWRRPDGNPWGYDIRLGNSPVFRPEDFGAMYNNNSEGQAKANTVAINKLIQDLRDTGGVMEISGHLFTYGTIRFPERAFYTKDLRPIPFTIRGKTPDAVIWNLADTYAVEIHGGYSWQNTTTIAPTGLEDIIIVSRGGGVYLKEVNSVMRNVVIGMCKGPYGLWIEWCHGLTLWDKVYVIDCYQNGVKIKESNLVSGSITARLNAGNGIEIEGSGAHQLDLYAEGNGEYGITVDRCNDIKIWCWMEGNRGKTYGKYAMLPQGKITNSTETKLSGQYYQVFDLGFECDNFSYATLREEKILSNIDDKHLIIKKPLIASEAWANPPEWGAFKFEEPAPGEIKVTVPPGAHSTPVQNFWIEPYSYYTNQPQNSLELNPGDAVVGRLTVDFSEEFVDVVKKHMGTDKVPFMFYLQHAAFPTWQEGGLGYSWHYPQRAGIHVIEIRTICKYAKTDILRNLISLYPARLEGHEPEAANSFTIKKLEMFLVRSK